MSDTVRPVPAPATIVPSPAPTAGPAQLVVLLAAICMIPLGAVLLAPLLPAMTKAFAGTSNARLLVEVSLTVPALVTGLLAPFAGAVLDRVDRSRVLVIALLVYSVAGTAPLYLGSLDSIIASRAVVGVCEAAIATCVVALISDYWHGARRTRYLGLQMGVATLSGTVFLALGGALGGLGWRTPFWLYAVAALLAVPAARLLYAAPRPDGPAGRTARLPWAALLVPCAVTVIGGTAFATLVVQLPFVLKDAGVSSTAAIGAVAAAASLATAGGAALFGRLAGHTPRLLLPIEFLVAAAGILLLGLARPVPLITAGAVLTGVGVGLLIPTLLAWTVNRLSFAERGLGSGQWTACYAIGQFLSVLIVTGLSSALGGLRPALATVAAATALTAVLSVLATRHNNRVLRDTKPQRLSAGPEMADVAS